MCLQRKEFSKSAAVSVWRRFNMMNDLISCFVLPFEHFYSEENPAATVSIYVSTKNKINKLQ